MHNLSSQVRPYMSTAQSELAKSPASDFNITGQYSHMTVEQLEFNFYALQQDAIALRSCVENGGEYVSDGFECVDFEHYSNSQVKCWSEKIMDINLRLIAIHELIFNRKIQALCQE